jgi:PIN domain nuclease of toxin-antitoxin system
MPSVVFDASAILALLHNEVGADLVSAHIGDGLISAVNLQEVIKELVRRGIALDASLEMLDALHLDVRAHDREGAIAAAALYPETHKHGCGLGDRTCMALAIAEKLPALTADKVWEHVEATGLQVQLVR